MAGIKALFIAFSIYSKIPVPQFPWKEEDMRYTLCFFPWVGAVIGAVLAAWHWVCIRYEISSIAWTAIGMAIPLFLSGGFHTDGFMDTMDAFSSYQSRERKLEILKDSHIGAFAVISLLICYLFYAGALSEIKTAQQTAILGAGFFLSRTLSGIGVISFPCAKKEGLLYLFASEAHKRVVKLSLYLQLVLCAAFLLWISFAGGIMVLCGAGITFFYYRWRCLKELGGITGDTAGYFVILCECMIAILTAVSGRI